MIKQAVKFVALSRHDRGTLATAFVLLPLAWLGLRLLGLKRMKAWAERATAAAPSTISHAGLAARGSLVNMAASYSPGSPNCLTRSLLLHWMLRRDGIASDLRIGTRLASGQFDAHAWVEVGGLPVNDAPHVAGRYDAVF